MADNNYDPTTKYPEDEEYKRYANLDLIEIDNNGVNETQIPSAIP